MKIKTIYLILVICLTTSIGFGQTPNNTSKNAYLNHLETLFKEGNHYYAEIGNKAQLIRIIEACETAINQGLDDGILTQKDVDSLLIYVKFNKLLGDYHYLNANEDSQSFAEAESHFKNALAFTENKSHARLQEVYFYQFIIHEELGQLYYKQKRYQEAYTEMKAAEKRASSSYLTDDDLLDFVSQLALCKARVSKFSEALDDIQLVVSQYQGKKTERYGEALRKKAKILMLQQENNGTGMANPSEEALKCYKDYYALKKDDAEKRLETMNPEDREAYWMRIRPFVVDCYRTENADPAFLYDVTLFSKGLLLEYAQKGKPDFCTWKKVQKSLNSGDCAIEFIQYEKRDEKCLGALVLKKKGQPQFVSIGSVGMIENLPLQDDWGTVIDALSEDQPDLKDALYTDSTIFSSIWTQQLLTAIGKDTKRVYFSPDGLIHQLAIEYMIPDAPWLTSLTSSDLYRLTSTRQLVAPTSIKRNSKLLTCGGIDYYKASASETNDTPSIYANDEQAYNFLKSMRLLRWNNLPGTMDEIEGIRNIYDSLLITSISEDDVTEACFTRIANQYPIVHLATHGFFGGILSEGTDLLPASYDESLSQNVLAFAGININLNSDNFDPALHDGILSAREIAQMDLSNIDLIVLSACQTGLGYLTDDGIYGLQRGLKNAGVKGMILSLWSVDDDATALLMKTFYTYLQSEDAHTAFMHARDELIATKCNAERSFDPVRMKNVTTQRDFSLPQFSNAFILIDIK